MGPRGGLDQLLSSAETLAFQSNSTFFFSEASLLHCWLLNSRCHGKHCALSRYYLCFEGLCRQLFQNRGICILETEMRLWILEFIIQLNQCLHLATAGLLSQPAWDAVVGKVLEGHFWVGEMRGAGASQASLDREQRRNFCHF